MESHHVDLAGAGAQQVHGMLQRLLVEMYAGPSTRRQESRSWYNLLVANNVPRLSKLVRKIIPWQKPVARGKVPSAVHDLQYIEPIQDVYHHRGAGTNMLGRDGQKRKAFAYMKSCLAAEHALESVLSRR